MAPRTPAKPLTPPTVWLTVDEAAKYARVGPSIIYKAAKEEHLSGVKLTAAPKSPWRFRATDVDAWLEKGRVRPAGRKAS